jgi:hypothetical protein
MLTSLSLLWGKRKASCIWNDSPSPEKTDKKSMHPWWNRHLQVIHLQKTLKGNGAHSYSSRHQSGSLEEADTIQNINTAHWVHGN